MKYVTATNESLINSGTDCSGFQGGFGNFKDFRDHVRVDIDFDTGQELLRPHKNVIFGLNHRGFVP